MNVTQENPNLALEQGIKVPITAPFFLRLLGLKVFRLIIKMPSLGNKMRITRLYLPLKISEVSLIEATPEQAQILMLRYGKTFTRIVALSLFKGFLLPWLLNRPVAWWLGYKLSPIKIITLVYILISQSGTAEFMSTIRLIQGMKITAPNKAPTK